MSVIAHRHFRDCPLTGHGADIGESTKLTLSGPSSSDRGGGASRRAPRFSYGIALSLGACDLRKPEKL